jgi:hypothetical protein
MNLGLLTSPSCPSLLETNLATNACSACPINFSQYFQYCWIQTFWLNETQRRPWCKGERPELVQEEEEETLIFRICEDSVQWLFFSKKIPFLLLHFCLEYRYLLL